MISPVVTTEPPPLPDPVRRAFARLEAWKAACIVLALVALSVPWVFHSRRASYFHDQIESGWSLLGGSSPFGAVLPWIVVKVCVVHLLLTFFLHRRPDSRLTAAWTFIIWVESTAFDSLLLWATGKARWEALSCWGDPLFWDGFFERYKIEQHLNPGNLLFFEAWLGVATLAFAVGPYMLYRGLQARARADVVGPQGARSTHRWGASAMRIVLLAICLLETLWFATRRGSTNAHE